MKRLLLVVFTVFLIASCDHGNDTSSNYPTKKLPHDFMFMQRAYPTGQLKPDALRKALQWKRQKLAQRSPVNVDWEFSGPVNIGGRITDIEIPIDQSQTYYVGAASGGIFKTTDGGNNWIPIFDGMDMLSIGDIEISKNNTDIVWVGTGEVNAGGGSLAYDGDGIYRSTNAGTSWEPLGLPDIGSVGKIVIDPNDENTVFVAAMGPLFRNDNNRGVYRTTNGGVSWEQKLFVSDSTGIIDMAIHPSNGNIVYAAAWERIRRPNNRQYGGETSGLYRSLDGGETWTEMTNGLPSIASEKGRISIDISQSNPDVLYSRYANASGSIEGVYRTSNGGDTWIEVNSSQLTNVGFHWWFRGIFVDPTDENTIYNIDFVPQKSTDGGNNWFGVFNIAHVDQHALAFNAMVPGEVLLGNDGGFYKSGNGGTSSVKDNTLPITQVYRIHVDAQNVDKVYIGTQDNSTIRTTTGGINDWNIITGGDGFQPLVDPTNTNVIYALSQNGNLVKSTNNGGNFSSAMSGISGSDRKNWNTPITFDPANSQTLYYGANRLYRTTNAAGNWTPISPDLSNGPHSGNLTFGTITTIDVSTLDSNIIYVGTDDGNVWFTDDGGTSWDLISAGLPDRWVTKVLASKDELNSVYVTYSGYRFGEDNGHVYRSIDNGLNWIDISTTLPDIPINDIVEDNYDNLFIGTDIGVMVSGDEGLNWEILGTNMPSVVVNDMHIHEGEEYLYAGTYGRSTYKIDVDNDILNNEDIAEETKISVYPNPARDKINLAIPNGFSNGELMIRNLAGQVVNSVLFTDSTELKNISIENLNSGLYLVTVKTNGLESTVKFVVQ